MDAELDIPEQQTQTTDPFVKFGGQQVVAPKEDPFVKFGGQQIKKKDIPSGIGGGQQAPMPSSHPIASNSNGQSSSNIDNRPEMPQSGAKISDVLAGIYKPVVANTDQNGIPKPPSIGNGKKTSQLVQAASDLTSTILPSRTGDLTTALNSGNLDAFLGIRDEINGKLSSALMTAKEDNRARQFSGAPAKPVLPIDIQKQINNSTPIAQMEQHAAQAKDDLNDLATTVIVKNRLPNASTSINIPQGNDPQVSQAIDESAASDIGKMMKEKLGISYSNQGNIGYDNTKTGLEAIIHTLRLNANDVLADGAANKDPVLLNKAIELSKSIDKNVSLYKELDDHYPDIQLDNTVRYLSDIATEKKMNTFTAFSSKDVYDMAKIAQERDPNFQTKMGKYVDIIAQGEGSGLLGQLQPGLMIRHDIASQVGRSVLEWTAGTTATLEGLGGNTNAQDVDQEVVKNLQSRYTSKEGALHDKVIFDNEGQAYVKKSNEYYGDLNFNSYTRMAANAIPGLAEWMVGSGVGSTIVKGLQEVEGLTAAIKSVGGLNTGTALATAKNVQEIGGVVAGSYFTGYSANRDIAENVIDDKSGWGDAKKAAFANLATLATAGVFHAIGANPAQVLQQSLTKSVSNDILATLEGANWKSLTKDGVEKLLTESVLPIAENILKGAGYSLIEGAKIATAGEVSNKLTQLAEVIVNQGKAKVTSTENDVNNITQQTLVMALLPAFGKLATKGFQLPYTAKDALVDAALKDGIIKSDINRKVDSGEYTQEQANGMISLINTMKESLQIANSQTDAKGLPFDQKQTKEWALADFKKKAAIHLREQGMDVSHIDAETDAAKKDVADQSGYVPLHENDIFKSIQPVDKNEEKPKTFLYIHANNEYTATINGETVTLKGDGLQEAIKKDAHDTNNIQSSNTANNESKINQGQENNDNSGQQQGVVQPEQVPGQSDQKGQVDNNGVLVPVSPDAPLPETVVLNGQEYKVKKDNGDGTVNVQKGDDPGFITVKKSELQHMQPKDNITIGDVMDKKVTYKGESATVYQDGQAVIIKIDGKPKEYEIGNVDELKNKPISDFGIEHEQSVVSINDTGDIKVSGQDYVNDFADPIRAIYKDDNGNLLYVHLKTKDGKDKLFTGNVAEDLAYQITLKEINKSDETRQHFEQFLATDPQFIADTKDAAVQNTTAKEATGNNTTVSRSKVETTATTTNIISNEDGKIQQPAEAKGTSATEADQNIQQSETKKTDSGKEVVFPSRNGDFAEKFFSKEKVGDATESEYEKWKRLKEDSPDEASKMISDKKEELLKDTEAKTTGITHPAQVKRSIELGIEGPKRGEGINTEEAIQHGRDLMSQGENANEAAADFKKDKKISYDALSLVRAKHEELVRETNRSIDTFGDNSKEAESALKNETDWYNDVVKPMQTEWSKIGIAQQGLVDIDTGSLAGIKRSFLQYNDGKPMTTDQLTEASRLSKTVKELSDKVDYLEKKIGENFDNSISNESKETKKTYTDKAKKAADTFRKLKTKEFKFKDKDGNEYDIQKMGLGWNEIVELGAKAIEKTGVIADGIAKVIDNLKDNEWFNSFSEEDKKGFIDQIEQYYTDELPSKQDRLAASRIKSLEKELDDLQQGNVKNKSEKREPTDREKELKDQIFDAKKNLGLIPSKQLKAISEEEALNNKSDSSQTLATKFVDKKDNTFSSNDAKDIWEYAKKEYLDKGYSFKDMLNGVSMDIGLSSEQVRHALEQPKGNKEISNEMYALQNKRNKAIQRAEIFVKNAKQPKIVKILKAVPSFFFEKAIFGHGTVGMVTHAGMNIFRPSAWATYFPNFIKQFKFAFGGLTDKGLAAYEKQMEDLTLSKNFILAKRAGLANDPDSVYDDYGSIKKFFGKLGLAGDRGFNALKVYRQDLFDAIYDKASTVEKSDPEYAKEIASMVNHATGTSKIPVPEGIGTAFFAPRLEASRWARLIGQPAKAIKTITDWSNASPAAKAAAKIVAKRTGETLATYAALLAANQGLLIATGSNQRINLTNPTDSDWLKFKGGGSTFDLSGGIVSTIGFVGKLVQAIAGDKRQLKGQKKGQAIIGDIGKYARGKLSPFGSTAFDFSTHHDYAGNTLPGFSDKPDNKFAHKMTWKEYLLERQTPIPVAEAITDVANQMKDKGMSELQISNILHGIFVGAVSGGTGARVSEDYKSNKINSQHKK